MIIAAKILVTTGAALLLFSLVVWLWRSPPEPDYETRLPYGLVARTYGDRDDYHLFCNECVIMPQAEKEDQDRMIEWFGTLDTSGPERFLESHGFELTRDWMWMKPTDSYRVSDDEYHCILFLIEEWDYGGIKNKAATFEVEK